MKERILGSRGERVAAAYLELHGCKVIARNARAGNGEIDIVALEGDVVVLAEVKTRSYMDAVPAESITRRKIRNLSRAALVYLNGKEWLDREIRFDVIEVWDNGVEVSVRHTRSAFSFDSSVLSRRPT